MQRFCDSIVCYLGSLAAISSPQIVQGTWFYPPDRLPVITVILFILKTKSLRLRIFRTSWRSHGMFC